MDECAKLQAAAHNGQTDLTPSSPGGRRETTLSRAGTRKQAGCGPLICTVGRKRRARGGVSWVGVPRAVGGPGPPKVKARSNSPAARHGLFTIDFFFFFCLQPVARAPRCAGTHAPAMSEEIDKHVLRKYEIAQRLGKGVRAGRAAAEERSGAGRGAPRRATRAPLRGGAPPPPCELGVASARRAGGAALERAVRRAEECRQWRGWE